MVFKAPVNTEYFMIRVDKGETISQKELINRMVPIRVEDLEPGMFLLFRSKAGPHGFEYLGRITECDQETGCLKMDIIPSESGNQERNQLTLDFNANKSRILSCEEEETLKQLLAQKCIDSAKMPIYMGGKFGVRQNGPNVEIFCETMVDVKSKKEIQRNNAWGFIDVDMQQVDGMIMIETDSEIYSNIDCTEQYESLVKEIKLAKEAKHKILDESMIQEFIKSQEEALALEDEDEDVEAEEIEDEEFEDEDIE